MEANFYETGPVLEFQVLGQESPSYGYSPIPGANGNWYCYDAINGWYDTGYPIVTVPHKGENGNWFIGDVDTGISTKGEKGEKGDPGEIDEETIRDTVNAWLAQNPITVPEASANTSGTVKVGTGLEMRNGELSVQSASDAFISSRATDSKFITPMHLDYAVKAAMTDGKGVAWTEEQQAAARERLGVPDEVIEHIGNYGETKEPAGKVWATTADGADWITLPEGGGGSSGEGYVSYRNFGAVLDGVHDDSAAVKAAHDYANANGIPIRESGGKLKLNFSVDVKTSCYLDLEFIIDNDTSATAYRIVPDATEDITWTGVLNDDVHIDKVLVDNGSDSTNITSTIVAGPDILKGKYCFVSCRNVDYKLSENFWNIDPRYSSGAPTSSNGWQHSQPLAYNELGEKLTAPLYAPLPGEIKYKFTNVHDLAQRPVVFEGGTVTSNWSKSVNFPSLVRCTRSNTTIRNIVVHNVNIFETTNTSSGSDAPGLIRLNGCANCIVENIYGFNNSLRWQGSKSSYVIDDSYTWNLIIRNVNVGQGWGAYASHWSDSVKVLDSQINRLDCHYGLFGTWLLSRCTLACTPGFAAIGYGSGEMVISECSFEKRGISKPCIEFRTDFPLRYSGTIIIDNMVANGVEGPMIAISRNLGFSGKPWFPDESHQAKIVINGIEMDAGGEIVQVYADSLPVTAAKPQIIFNVSNQWTTTGNINVVENTAGGGADDIKIGNDAARINISQEVITVPDGGAAAEGPCSDLPALKIIEFEPVPGIDDQSKNSATSFGAWCVDAAQMKMYVCKRYANFAKHTIMRIALETDAASAVEQTANLYALALNADGNLDRVVITKDAPKDSSNASVSPVDMVLGDKLLYIAVRGGTDKPNNTTVTNGFILAVDKDTLETVQIVECNERPTRLSIVDGFLFAGNRGQYSIYAIDESRYVKDDSANDVHGYPVLEELYNNAVPGMSDDDVAIDEWHGGDAAYYEGDYYYAFGNYDRGVTLYKSNGDFNVSINWHWPNDSYSATIPDDLYIFAVKIVDDYVYALLAPKNSAVKAGRYTKGILVRHITGGEAKIVYLPDAYTGVNCLTYTRGTNGAVTISGLGDPDPSRVWYADHRLYFSNASAGIAVVDVSRPGNPVYLGNIKTGTLSSKVEVHGHLMFVAGRFDAEYGQRNKVYAFLI